MNGVVLLESKSIRLTSRFDGRQITHAELGVNQNFLPFVNEPKFQLSVSKTSCSSNNCRYFKPI